MEAWQTLDTSAARIYLPQTVRRYVNVQSVNLWASPLNGFCRSRRIEAERARSGFKVFLSVTCGAG